jgi:hypothetical protein
MLLSVLLLPPGAPALPPKRVMSFGFPAVWILAV